MVTRFQIVHKGALEAFDPIAYRLPALGDFRLTESWEDGIRRLGVHP